MFATRETDGFGIVQIRKHNTRTGVEVTETRHAVWRDGGLAVTRAVPSRLGWAITHIGSGLAIGPKLRSRETARRLAQALVELGDFTRQADELTNDTALRAAARPIIDAYEGDY
jgi:hypothetical protein